MSTTLDIPSSSGIVIVENSTNSENILTTVQLQSHEHHLPIHHVSHQSNDSGNNLNMDYNNLSANVDDQNVSSGVINFTTNEVLNNTQILKFVSDDNTTTAIIDQPNEELNNYCTTGRLLNNQTSKVHVIGNLPYTQSNKQSHSQQAINLVSNGKNITAGVNFVNAYITKTTLPGGKIVNIPVKATSNSNTLQHQIHAKTSTNQLVHKVPMPRNVQFVTRTQTSIAGGNGNIVMSRTSGSGVQQNTTSVIHAKGQQHQQILVPHSSNVKLTNNIKNKSQLQTVKIFQGAQKPGGTLATTMKTVLSHQPSQKLTAVKTNLPGAGIANQNKYNIKQFSPISNNSTITNPPQFNKNSSHGSQTNLVYATHSNMNTNSNNNNFNGSSGKIQSAPYQRSNINNVLFQGKMLSKGNKYVVQHNTNQTHIVLPSAPVSGNGIPASGNIQPLKISQSYSNNGGAGGTIKYVNAHGNVIQAPQKVRAIFQQASSSSMLPNLSNQQQNIYDSANSSNETMSIQTQISNQTSNSMEDMIVNGTIMTDEMSARILQSLSQQKILYNTSSNQRQTYQINNIQKSYQSTNAHPKMIASVNHESNHNNTQQVGSNRENYDSRNERYYKVSSCDLSTTTTFIDNIPLTSTRGDTLSHGHRLGDDSDDIIGEEIRPAPMTLADGKISLLQMISQDHTYAANQPEQPKKIQNPFQENLPSLSSSNIQSAGLNFGYKPSTEDDANSVISTGSRNGNNLLDNDLGEETETAPEAEGEDESETRCICELTHDDGYMICCDKCSQWQHVDCMGIDRQNIPEEYRCEICQPRQVDKQRARALQLLKRKEQQNLLLLNAQQQLQQTSALENNTSQLLLGQQQNDRSVLQKGTLSTQGKKIKTSVKKKADLSSFAQQKKERKLSARANGKRKETKKLSKKKSKLHNELPTEKGCSLRQWIENYEQAITNHYSPELRARLHAMGKQNQLTREIPAFCLKNVNNLDEKCVTIPHAGGKILISTTDLSPSVPVVEIRGKYMLSSQFRQQQAISTATGSIRNHQYNRKPGPFIFFYRLPKDGPEVCIDTRTYGNEARFVRRSCRPNAEVLHSIEKGAIHLYIVSLSHIANGTEITIKHEPHDLAAVTRGTNIAPTSTVCACGCPKDCSFVSATQNNINQVSQKPLKKMNGNIVEDGTLSYRKLKLPSRGRSTSSSGDSNTGLLSPNNIIGSVSAVMVQQTMLPLVQQPSSLILPRVVPESNIISPQIPDAQPVPLLSPTPVARPQTLNITVSETQSLFSENSIISPIPSTSHTLLIPMETTAVETSPLQSIAAPNVITPPKTTSPSKTIALLPKKSTTKVRHISFSEETTSSVLSSTNSICSNISTPSEDTTNIIIQKQNSRETKEKDKDSPKLTREERKMQAIMKAFEKMEKNQERKQQLKQNKTVTMSKGRSSSPSSPKRIREEDNEKSYHPRKKKRKGCKPYQQLSSHKKLRRRSRMNSGDSDLMTSEESTSLLSPPHPPSTMMSFSPDHLKSPENQEQQKDNTISSAAGLLLALSHSHNDEDFSTIKSPAASQSLEPSPIVTTPPHVSSACLLIEAAVAPLEHTDHEIKFKTKTKKSIMNDWLHQAESLAQSEKASMENISHSNATMCNYTTLQQSNHFHMNVQEEPENLSMVAKKVEEFIFQSDTKLLATDEEDLKWQPHPNTSYTGLNENSGSTVHLSTPPGNLGAGSGSAAKKRWLRQAISEECNDDIPSPPNGFTTPLKKRRLARQCSDIPIDDISPQSVQYTSVFSSEITQLKHSPNPSQVIGNDYNLIQCLDNKEIKLESLDIRETGVGTIEQDDEIDVLNTPPEEEKIVPENITLIKIEPEDEEKDEKIDVENIAIQVKEDISEFSENKTEEGSCVDSKMNQTIPEIIKKEENGINFSSNEDKLVLEIKIEESILEEMPKNNEVSAEYIPVEPFDESYYKREDSNELISIEESAIDLSSIYLKTEKQDFVENICEAKDTNETQPDSAEIMQPTINEMIYDNANLEQPNVCCSSLPDSDTKNELDSNLQINELETINVTASMHVNDVDTEIIPEIINEENDNKQPADNLQNNNTISENISETQSIIELSTELVVDAKKIELEHTSTENEAIKEHVDFEITNENNKNLIPEVVSDVKEINFEHKTEQTTHAIDLNEEKVNEITNKDILSKVLKPNKTKKKMNKSKLKSIKVSEISDEPLLPPKTENSTTVLINSTQNMEVISETIIGKKIVEENKDQIESKDVQTLAFTVENTNDSITKISTSPNSEDKFECTSTLSEIIPTKLEEQVNKIEIKEEISFDNELVRDDEIVDSNEDEIADIQKRLHSFHTENILILKSRNKKTKLSPIQQISVTPQVQQKSKKTVQLNFDLSVQDDETVSVKLKEITCDNEPITVVTKIECKEEKSDDLIIQTQKTQLLQPRETTMSLQLKEERHTRWDKPDESRFNSKSISSISTADISRDNNTSQFYSSYSVNSTNATSNLSNYGSSSSLQPSVHIPPNTPASHLQYYNAFYNKFSTDDSSKSKYSFSLADYLEGNTTNNIGLNTTNKTSFRSNIDSFSGVYNATQCSLLDTQSSYYSTINSSSSSVLMSSFLNKSYGTEASTMSIPITPPQPPPKVLTRAQSADPRLNPNLNVPEPPPPPKRKLSINEYRKRKQQSSETVASDKSATLVNATSSAINSNENGNGTSKSDHEKDILQIRLADDKDRDVLFSPAPTQLEMQQEILSERLKTFKSLQALTSSLPKADDTAGLSYTTKPIVKERDCIESLHFDSVTTRSNRLSTGSDSSSSSFSSINSENRSPANSSPISSTSLLKR